MNFTFSVVAPHGETKIGKLLIVVDVFFVCFCFFMKMPRVCGSHVLDGGSPEEKPGLAKLPRASVQAVTSPTNCHARYRPALDLMATTNKDCKT